MTGERTVCSACAGTDYRTRLSIWHSTPICLPCFYMWYDGELASEDDRTKPEKIGEASRAAREAGKWPYTMSAEQLGLLGESDA